jgi:hypothetical protein
VRGLALASFLFAVAALFPGAVFGQKLGPPIPLFPKHPSRAGGAVTTTPLTPPPEGWSGDVSPKGKPLPEDFWQGTPRALADTLFAHLPAVRSPSLQALERRLLLSPGEPPQGPDAAGLYLPFLRARRLLQLGELSAARAIVAATAAERRGPLWRLAVDADAIGGQLDRACGTVRDRIQSDKTIFWQRALVACQALEGKIREARLGLQILAEEGAAHKGELSHAVDALAHQPAPKTVQRLVTPDPLLLRLIVASGRTLDPSLVNSLSPGLALALARDEKAPPATRLLAALRAARFGALGRPRLRALLTAIDGAVPGDRALSAAQQFAAIGQASQPADRLARISKFVRGLGGSGSFILGARLVAPELRAIAPEPSLAPSALDAARLLLAAGDRARARRWVALVPATEGKRLALLLHLVQKPEDGGEDADAAEIGQSVLSLALFAALGKPVSAAAWVALPPPSWSAAGRVEAPAVSRLDLAEAARAKRIGETVLEAIIVAGSQGRLSTDPVALYTAISSLREIGLERDARHLALEAALAADL